LLLLFSCSSSSSCSLSLFLLLQRLQKLCNNKRNKEQPAGATTATHTRLLEIDKGALEHNNRAYIYGTQTHRRRWQRDEGCSFLAAFGSRFYPGKLVNFVPPRPPASYWFSPVRRREVTFFPLSLSSVC
jgi:hypothetical protein